MSKFTCPEIGTVRSLEEAENDLSTFDQIVEAEKTAKEIIEEQLNELTAENVEERMKIMLDATAKEMFPNKGENDG